MANSEDYLDGLLDSITQAKNDVSNADRRERRSRQERQARRTRVSADDDFMEANGLNDYVPRSSGHSSLQSILDEADFLREFEEELDNGEADAFLAEFENELRNESANSVDNFDIDDNASRDSGNVIVNDELPLEFVEETPVEEPIAETPVDLDLSVEDIEVPTDVEPEDNLMQSIEDIVSEAKSSAEADKPKPTGSSIGEDFLQPEFEPDELDLSDASKESGSGVPEITLVDPNGSEEEMDLSSLFGESTDAQEVQLMDESGEGIDLSEMMSGDDSLSEIGDLLSADASGEELDEARDAFEASAEAAEEGVDLSDASFEGEEEGKKPGLLAKILGIFKKKKKSEDDEALDELLDISEQNPTPEELAAESDDLLASFSDELTEPEEEAPKEKKKKEKKKKEKKPKKEKPPKPPKEKKPKKPKEPDNSPKIPLKVIIVFLLLAISIIVFVFVAQKTFAVKEQFGRAQSYFDTGDYIAAYSCVSGVETKDEARQLFIEKTKLLAMLQMKNREYEVAMSKKDYGMALDSLIIGVIQYTEKGESADTLGVKLQYDTLGSKMIDQLNAQFAISPEEARDIFYVGDRQDYTLKIYDILEEKGLK
ncbi:MAG: hypothetical protein K6A05_01770 [Lachnospiraceae bacterium]|nr:hypothetical protein [Lachnospiraceae bacterium]